MGGPVLLFWTCVCLHVTCESFGGTGRNERELHSCHTEDIQEERQKTSALGEQQSLTTLLCHCINPGTTLPWTWLLRS